jgi:hypothetical protein
MRAAAGRSAGEEPSMRAAAGRSAGEEPSIRAVCRAGAPRVKVLFAASEALPYFKTGGLADVARTLPDALAAVGYDVRVALPALRLPRRPAGRRGTRGHPARAMAGRPAKGDVLVASPRLARAAGPLHAPGPRMGPLRRTVPATLCLRRRCTGVLKAVGCPEGGSCVRAGGRMRHLHRARGRSRALTESRSAGRVQSRYRGNSSVGRASACQAEGRRFESGFPLSLPVSGGTPPPVPGDVRARGEVVTQRSAKPPFAGSNPAGPSNEAAAPAMRRPFVRPAVLFDPRRPGHELRARGWPSPIRVGRPPVGL